MKRKIMIFIIIIIMAFFAGCGEMRSELQTVYRFSDNSYQPQYITYREADMKWTKTAEKVENQIQTEINQIAEDLCDFLNNDFEAEWKVEPIETYAANITEILQQQTTTLTYGACYYEEKIFVDKAFLQNGLDNQAQYMIVHELIHYLYYLNSGSKVFAIYEQGMYCGKYLDEAIVDALAKKYMLARHPEMEQKSDKSHYTLIRLFVDLQQLEIPVFQYFFRNDIQGMKEAVDEHVEKYVLCEESPFEKMISMMDEIVMFQELQSDRASAIMTLLALTTSSEHAEMFVNKAEKAGINAEEFVPYMY